MTQGKYTTIKQGAISDVMSHLSELPKRPKDPGKPITLSEMFKNKKHAATIERAIKKGYTFDDLAAIFSEQSGVKVTARQMKYHHTRAKNDRAKEEKARNEEATVASARVTDSSSLAQ